MFDRSSDARVRSAAFEWLSDQVARLGDVLPRSILTEGFTLDGMRVPLMGPQGIFKPKVLQEIPLSITSAPDGPYDDSFGPNNLLRYRYRGTNVNHADNHGLRSAMENRLPLVYFHGLVPGKYLATWPVFVVADNPVELASTSSMYTDVQGYLMIAEDRRVEASKRTFPLSNVSYCRRNRAYGARYGGR
jgi:putative restriction endonuclease